MIKMINMINYTPLAAGPNRDETDA